MQTFLSDPNDGPFVSPTQSTTTVFFRLTNPLYILRSRRLISNPIRMLYSHIHVTRRHLPHWTIGGATYFITFRTKGGSLTVEEQVLALEHFKHGDEVFYSLIAVIVMPDHVHILLTPREHCDLSRVMKGLKGVAAHKINAVRGSRGHVWQDESYDRIVRNNKELRRFFRYMLNNPLKKGFCKDPWTYHGWYCNQDMNPLE